MKAVQIPPNAVYKCVLLFPGFEGRVGCIPRGPPYPRIHCKSKVEEISGKKWWTVKAKLLKVSTE